MGWASGSSLCSEVVSTIRKHVKDDKARASMYKAIINAFEDHDCDTLCECLGDDPAFDAVYSEMYPKE